MNEPGSPGFADRCTPVASNQRMPAAGRFRNTARRIATHVLAALIITTIAVAAGQAMPARHMQGLYIIKSDRLTCVYVAADGPITAFEEFTLKDRARIILDLPGLTSRYAGLQTIDVDTRWVQRVRFFEYPDKLRLVIETYAANRNGFTTVPVSDGLQILVADRPPAAAPMAGATAGLPAFRSENISEQPRPEAMIETSSVESQPGNVLAEEIDAHETGPYRQAQALLIAQTEPPAAALGEAEPERSGFVDELMDGFDYLLKVVGSGTRLKSNLLAGSRLHLLIGEIRPDFYLNYKNLRLSAKPRGSYVWQDVKEGDDSDAEAYVNEWLAGIYLTRNLFASYGRENLQWGPSYLFSPSNPFFKDNGRTNPLSEIPGLDFGKAIWVLNPTWTFSLYANTDEGRQEFPLGFEKTYAAKLDFTQNRRFLSLIGSKREGDRARFSGYGGWTVTDALMLHAELDVFYELNPDYKLARFTQQFLPDIPVDTDIDQYSDHDLDALVLVGGAYTLLAGPTLVLEYVYNGDGLSDGEVNQLRDTLELLSPSLDPFIGFQPRLGNQNFFLESTLFRRHYLMGQYQQLQIWNRLGLFFRYLFNIDDESSLLTSIVTLNVGDRTQLYFVGKKSFGPDDTEFPLIFDYSITMGFEFTF